MKLYKGIVALVLLTLLSTVLIACEGHSTIKVGWVGNDTPGSFAYSYRRFSGIERDTFRADAGETLTLDYELEVEEGSLKLRIQDPGGTTLWETEAEADVEDVVRLTLEQEGRYQIQLEGHDTRGAFDLEWERE